MKFALIVSSILFCTTQDEHQDSIDDPFFVLLFCSLFWFWLCLSFSLSSYRWRKGL